MFSGRLLSTKQVEACYVGECIPEDAPYGYVIAVDVGGGVGRDDSVIAVGKVWGNALWGEDARRVEIVEIPLCKNKDDINELFGIISDCMDRYSNASLVVDTNGAGTGLGQMLKSYGFHFTPVHWGGACFNQDTRKEFVNKRAQAYVSFKRAVERGYFKILTKKYATKLKEQIVKIPYSFDEQSRYKIKSKDAMRKEGIKSPDIGDVLAFMFLENVNYAEAYENSAVRVEDTPEAQEQVQKQSRFDRLKQEAKKL